MSPLSYTDENQPRATTLDLDRLRELAETANGDWLNQTGAGSVLRLDRQTVLDLIEKARLGAAWNRVEAALPEGWDIALNMEMGRRPVRPRYFAYARSATQTEAIATVESPTPADALNALADALTVRQP